MQMGLALPVMIPSVIGGHISVGPTAKQKRSELSHCVKNCPACLLSKISPPAAEVYRETMYVGERERERGREGMRTRKNSLWGVVWSLGESVWGRVIHPVRPLVRWVIPLV